MSRRGKTATVLGAVAIVGGMAGLTAAAVPLYRLFCQVTGYGGTTRVAEGPVEAVEQTITVRFNADHMRDLPWSFKAEQGAVTLPIGETSLAFFKAENRSDEPVVGTATYNVTPFVAGPYFSKIQCFCFTEQALRPGQSMDMPVSFYVDPAILDDPETKDLREITLSYTFFLNKAATAALAQGAVPGEARGS